MDKVVEVQIRKVSLLSEAAKQEVKEKLSQLNDNFKFMGYAKVSYAQNSPLRVVSVDPIEGTVVDYFNELANKIEKIK